MVRKNYLIVGGSSGIGLATARVLVAQGHGVHVLSRSVPALDNITHLPGDALVGDFNAAAMPDTLHGLVYCPGSINLKPFHRLTVQDFTADFAINVLGAVNILQRALPALKAAPQSSVVLYSTVAVQQGMGFHASVAAAKGALEGLGRSLAAEWAPKIRVNVVAPSLTRTPLAAKLLSSEDKEKAAAERHPLKRIGEADELAQLTSFLLSDHAGWITGQVLHADGGLSAIR
jgi:NAD(P)-dependent dehydrogenase (short-subunit alcohol dehydrogenase family)